MKIYNDYHEYHGKNAEQRIEAIKKTEQVNAFIKNYKLPDDISIEDFLKLNSHNNVFASIVVIPYMQNNKRVAYKAYADVNDYNVKNNRFSRDLVVSRAIGFTLEDALKKLLGKNVELPNISNIENYIQTDDEFLRIFSFNGNTVKATVTDKNPLGELPINHTTEEHKNIQEALSALHFQLEGNISTNLDDTNIPNA